MSASGGGRRAWGARAALLAAGVGLTCAVHTPAASAQHIVDTLVVRGLELEGNGQPRYAAPLYRRALRGSDAVAALLGLERVYAELGMTDSLLAPLDSVVARMPADPTVRAVQLRTLTSLERDDAVRAAARDWTRHAPADPAPYRELARLLLAAGRAQAADSVITAAQRALGGAMPFAQEIAQIRAAAGAWAESAEAWRGALATSPWLHQAAAHALAATPPPHRAAVRAAFMRAPATPPARMALAALETTWGSSALGWDALKDLPADSASADAWIAFGDLSELEGRWGHARAAFESALRWRATDPLRLRAASAALAAGDAAGALALLPIARAAVDSQQVATEVLPLHVAVLTRLGRAGDAERLVATFDRFVPPGLRVTLAREIAMGWARTGDMARARQALASGGEDADSSAASGWIALYEGDAHRARALLGRGEERTADVALALGVLGRFRDPRAPELGAAFLTLARGDTAAASRAFLAAATHVPRAASLLLLTAARLAMATGDTAAALAAWEGVVASHGDSPEAPEALLLGARALAGRGDRTKAAAQLERLLLGYPASALVPVARRELEQLRPATQGAP